MVSLRQQVLAATALKMLVNVVVPNLFVEFADEVVIDSFVVSVLTAGLLTVMLGAIVKFEEGLHHFFFEAHSRWIDGVITIWIVLFASKFLILEVVDVVFGHHLYIGHLLKVILIVVAFMVAGQLCTPSTSASCRRPDR